MITLGQLAKIRQIHETTGMPDTATAYRRTLATDTTGAQVETFTASPAELPFPCRLSFYGGNRPNLPDTQQGGTIRQPERFILTYPASVTLAVEDRVEVNGVLYGITSTVDARSFETAKRVLVTRIV